MHVRKLEAGTRRALLSRPTILCIRLLALAFTVRCPAAVTGSIAWPATTRRNGVMQPLFGFKG